MAPKTRQRARKSQRERSNSARFVHAARVRKRAARRAARGWKTSRRVRPPASWR